jgi:hypothetical protein
VIEGVETAADAAKENVYCPGDNSCARGAQSVWRFVLLSTCGWRLAGFCLSVGAPRFLVICGELLADE